jgi:hypothetical protein
MRKFVLIFIFLSGIVPIVNNLYSQNSDPKSEPKYLIDLTKTKLTGFGNTHSELSFINSELAYSSGASGAFLFNYKFYAGIYSLSLQSNHLVESIYPANHNPITNPLEPSYSSNKIRFNHGGLMFGYILEPNNLWHLNTNIKIGSGRIALTDKDFDFSNMDTHHSDWVGVVTPEVDVELNLARWCKVGFSLGYRFVFAVDKNMYVNEQGESQRLFSSSQFSSPMAAIKFHFGSFGPRRNGNNN